MLRPTTYYKLKKNTFKYFTKKYPCVCVATLALEHWHGRNHGEQSWLKLNVFTACTVTYSQISLCCECQLDGHVTWSAASHRSFKYRVHELPAWPFLHGWNPLACYVAHSLSVIQLRINSCMSACVVTYTSHRLLLIKSSLRLAPGRCSIPLVISLVLAVCIFCPQTSFSQQIQLLSSFLDIKYCMCFTI